MRRYSFHHPGKINDALIAGAPFLHATHSRRRNRAKHGSYVTPSRDSLGLLSKFFVRSRKKLTLQESEQNLAVLRLASNSLKSYSHILFISLA